MYTLLSSVWMDQSKNCAVFYKTSVLYGRYSTVVGKCSTVGSICQHLSKQVLDVSQYLVAFWLH